MAQSLLQVSSSICQTSSSPLCSELSGRLRHLVVCTSSYSFCSLDIKMADDKNLSSNGSTPTHDEHAANGILHQQPHPHAEHGPLIDHEITQDRVIQAHPELAWSRFRHFMREPCRFPSPQLLGPANSTFLPCWAMTVFANISSQSQSSSACSS
jgi:hypothetical protein